MMNALTRRIDAAVLVFAVAISVLASVFMGYKNAKIDMIFADAISDNNFLQRPFQPHDIYIQALHTHLLKWPLMLFENQVGFNVFTHRLTSIALLLVMNLWLAWYFYKFSKGNKVAASISLLLLSSIEIMTGLSANEGTLSMFTIRNIEVPIIIFVLLFSLRQKAYFTPVGVLVTLLLAVVFVSDLLLFYTSIVGLIFYLAYVVNKRRSLSGIDNRPLYVNVFVAAVLSKVIAKLFMVLGLANFYKSDDDNLLYGLSFKDMFNIGLDYIGRIFGVFGADFFGKHVYDGPIFIPNIVALGLTVVLGLRFFRDLRRVESDSDPEQRTILLLFLMYVFAMLIFTVLIPRELAGRYFVFLPVIGLLLLSYYLRDIRIPEGKAPIILMSALVALTSIFFATEVRAANRIFYNSKYDAYSAQAGDTAKVANLLAENGAAAYVDSSYIRFEVVKENYDRATGGQLATVWLPCDTNKVIKHFSRKSWAQPSGKRVGVRARDCDKKQTMAIFGMPDKIVDLSADGKDQLFIYNADVRDKLNLADFDKI